MKRILVCGSRNFNDKAQLREGLLCSAEQSPHILHNDVLIIHGGCAGADALAAECAHAIKWWTVCCPADWEHRGLSAGPLRNQAMLDEFKPDIVLAFPIGESKGTRDMIRRAESAGIPVEVFDAA